MPPKLPPRYRTQVRLGRDQDVEEWLATDTALDRPVLVRALAQGSDDLRVTRFVAASRAAASVSHPHLSAVYEVGSEDGTAFAILEWNGGVSVADRLRASDPLPPVEFLPNAAGLAGGLAALHDIGSVHGGIDPSAIELSTIHPAKLGAYGRVTRNGIGTARDDVSALGRALRVAVTGSEEPDVRPSQVVEGLPARVDAVLSAAEAGELDAAGLAAALRSVPAEPRHRGSRGWSWGWTVPATMLIVAMALLGLIGLTIEVDPDSPFLFPASPSPDPTAAAPDATTVPPGGDRATLEAAGKVFDPFGEGTENDDLVAGMLDADPDTAWSTERYFTPLSSLKPGVGVKFDVDGAPVAVSVRGSVGTRFEVLWSDTDAGDLDVYEPIAAATIVAAGVDLQLPPRPDGTWLLWLVELPEQSEGVYFAELHTVAFSG